MRPVKTRTMEQDTSDVPIWSASLREAGLLIFLAILATVGFWLIQDNKLPLKADPTFYELELSAPLVTIENALNLYDEGEYLFVDTRAMTSNRDLLIPGSFFIRSASFDDDLMYLIDEISAEDPLILYGSGKLHLVNNVALKLVDRGYTNILILQGGISAWQNGNGEVKPNKTAEAGQ